MFKLIDFDHVQSQRIRRFAAYWHSKISNGPVPHRRDIDPVDLKPILPFMMVVEIEAEPFRVLYRLAGTKVVEMNSIELTGRYLDSLDEDGINYTREGIAAYRLAWTSQQPVFGAYRWPTPSGAEYQVEFAIFPVSEAGCDGQCIALEDWEIDPVIAARHEPPLPYVKAPPVKPRK
ncbi:MAG TPA: PAS domain-containing protein [Dongiaceae bacterium]|nr:PAS domain-containing protein [Dongiaceae bacterium]